MIFAAFSIVFYLALLRNILFWLSYIQRKQYRFDRLWQAAQDSAFWRLFWSKWRILYTVLFLGWQLGVRLFQSGSAFDLLFFASALMFAIDATLTIWHGYTKRLERPVFTAKSTAIFAVALIVNVFITRLAWFGTPYGWRLDIILPEHALLLIIVQPLIVVFVFGLLYAPNLLLQRYTIRQATRKRTSLKQLTVIGITGSVGKTSMKETLAYLLAQKYSVLKTPKHINVDTGIAHQVLHELNNTHRFYIVEMGAYKRGEIASICRMVQPQYAVLTALGNQHLELFGSHEELRDTKFELVEAVANPQQTFMNYESPRLRIAAQQKGISPVWYGLANEADVIATNVTYTETHITCEIASVQFAIPGFGTARLMNALGAIAVAHALGLSFAELSTAIQQLPQLEGTGEVFTGPGNSFCIDSTYNASVDSVVTATNDLAYIARSKKYIVFKDIIELGTDARTGHEQCAEAFAKSQAHIVLLPSPMRETMIARLRALGVPPIRIQDERSLSSLTSSLDNQTVVLALGRDAQQYIHSLKPSV